MARIKQGYRTIPFPAKDSNLPDRFRGRPFIDINKCRQGCSKCSDVCPTDAIFADDHSIDLGRCLFCTDCVDACPEKAISFTKDYRLAVRKREELILKQELKLASAIEEKSRKMFGHSLKLREVSAGGCNACEADVNVLGTIRYDIGRFGIQMVASPRHSDGLLITGPVPKNMQLALQKTYDAVPSPKIVIAVGSCAVSGGPFAGNEEQNNGAGSILPVDLFIPGCPPHPLTTLDGILRLLGRIE